MNVEALRHRLSLTQGQLATLMGVSQAAVSQYESGHRRPAGDSLAFYHRLAAAANAPVVVEDHTRRTATLPAQRWERVIDPARVDAIELPVRLDWSPRSASTWRYHDVDHRREIYRLVLDVGEAIDVMTYLDVDELIEWADELPVARAVRPALQRLIERTTVPTGV